MRSATVLYQFGDILRSVQLPPEWREAIAEQCAAGEESDDSAEHVRSRRLQLESEQDRLMSLFVKGYITEEKLDEQLQPIRTELFTLPVPTVRGRGEIIKATVSAGEALPRMADYWVEAMVEERRDIVWSLLMLEGLIYDLERRAIVGIVPRSNFLPVLALGLEGTGQWERRDHSLWLRDAHLLPKLERNGLHLPPPQAPSLTALQQEEALNLISQGKSIREVAEHLGASRSSIHRLVQKAGITLPTPGKLTSAQQQEVLELVQQGMSLRQTARRFGVTHESIRRLVQRLQRKQEEE